MTDVPAPPRRRRRMLTFFVGLLAVLVLLEVAARLAESNGADALRWYDASTQLRADEIEERDHVDVVFAGTSMAWQGLVPSVWSEADAEGRSAYNVGMAGGVPEVMEPWLLEVVQPQLQPDLVVWGLSTLDFSTSYGADNLERYEDALETRTGALAELERFASKYSALVRYRNVLRDPAEWGESRGLEEAAAILGDDGERRDFVVDTSAERGRQVQARLSNYSLDTADIEAIHRTVVALQAAGTDVVFVQMPVPERFAALHPDGAEDIAATRRAINRLGELLGVDVVDATSGFADLDFVDFTHLNEQHAAELTTRVAHEVSGGEPEPAAEDPAEEPAEEPAKEPAKEATIGDGALLAIANDLVAMADVVRSAMTQTGSLPSSSEVWLTGVEYGHTRDLWAYAEKGVDFHTIFMGDSMAYAGFDPAIYREETGRSAYNAAVAAGGPEEYAAHMENTVLQAMSPRRVIIGAAPRSYDAIGTEESCGDRMRNYDAAQLVRVTAFEAVDWFRPLPDPHILFGDPVTHEPTGRKSQMHDRFRDSFSLLGDRSRYPTLSASRLREQERTIKRRMADYVFCQDRLDALASLVSDLDDQGIEVVVVGMPLASIRWQNLPGGRAEMEQVMADTEAAVLAAGAADYLHFVDLLDDARFYDYTHADRAGSHQLTRAVADALAGG